MRSLMIGDARRSTATALTKRMRREIGVPKVIPASFRVVADLAPVIGATPLGCSIACRPVDGPASAYHATRSLLGRAALGRELLDRFGVDRALHAGREHGDDCIAVPGSI